jgi:hypothetical protein
MIIDGNLEFADAVSVGAPNGNILGIGDDIDLDLARDVAHGEPMACVVQITTALTSGGAASVSFRVVSDAAAPAATNETTTLHGKTDTILVTALTAGIQLVIPLAPEFPNYERFLSFQIEETASAAVTAGAVNAFLVPMSHVQKWQSYPDAVN